MTVFALSTWRSSSLQPGDIKRPVGLFQNQNQNQNFSSLPVLLGRFKQKQWSECHNEVCFIPTLFSSERLFLWWTALSSRRKWEMWQSSCTSCWQTLWSPGILQLCWWHATNKVKPHLCFSNLHRFPPNSHIKLLFCVMYRSYSRMFWILRYHHGKISQTDPAAAGKGTVSNCIFSITIFHLFLRHSIAFI